MSINVSVRSHTDTSGSGGLAEGIFDIDREALSTYEAQILANYITLFLPIKDLNGLNRELNRLAYNLYKSDSELAAVTGTDKTYIHVQSMAATTWSVNHGLDKYPSVTIVDSGDNIVIGDIQYTDLNNLVVLFSVAFGGKAYIN